MERLNWEVVEIADLLQERPEAFYFALGTLLYKSSHFLRFLNPVEVKRAYLRCLFLGLASLIHSDELMVIRHISCHLTNIIVRTFKLVTLYN
jgi:hypothetical protein